MGERRIERKEKKKQNKRRWRRRNQKWLLQLGALREGEAHRVAGYKLVG